MTHDELVCIARDWLIKPYANSAIYGHGSCGVVITELSSATWGGEIPDALGFAPNKSILIECKVSLSDFRADKNKVFRLTINEGSAIGNQRWYMAPVGVIPNFEIPDKWGFLEVGEDKKVKVIKRSENFGHNANSEITLLLSAMRRLNVARDGHIRIQKYQPVAPVKKFNRKTREWELIGEAVEPRASVYIEEGGEE